MKRFEILLEFLKGLSFKSPNCDFLIQGWEKGAAEIENYADVQIYTSHENLYMVDLFVKLESKIEEKTMFNVTAVYTALVRIENIEVEEEKQQTLLIDVATVLFPIVRSIIEPLIMNSGYPTYRITMPDFHELYLKRQKSDDKKNSERQKVCNEDCQFNFEQFVKEVRKEVVQKDLDSYENVCGVLPDKFEDLIFYKNYLRFFKPIKYKIPEKFEADDINLDILFQLLAGSLSYEYQLKIEEDYLLTLMYKEENKSWKNVSDLKGRMVKQLIDDLLIDAMSSAMSLYQEDINTNTTFAETLPNDRIPTWVEFLHIYGHDEVSVNNETVKSLKDFYDKLQEYDLKIFQLTGRNEIDEVFE